jgi:hypothetical protein
LGEVDVEGVHEVRVRDPTVDGRLRSWSMSYGCSGGQTLQDRRETDTLVREGGTLGQAHLLDDHLARRLRRGS